MEKLGGYAGKFLRINLTKGEIKKEPLRRGFCEAYIGGRGFGGKIIFDEVKPETDPLSPDNVLAIFTGPVVGLLGPTSGRISVSALSPLTGIYGNSNSGTHWGPELKYAGYDGIVLVGKAETPKYLYINDDQVELRDASHLWGKGVMDTTKLLLEECGPEFKVAAIGPAAEKGVLFGNIIFDFWDAAARTGMGTVMASKNLKAIAVKGSGGLEVAKPREYWEVAREGWLALLTDPGFKTQEHPALGTLVVMGWGNALGFLPTRNFRETYFEKADQISGERFRDLYNVRETPFPAGRACMSCPNRCKRYGKVESGKYAGTRGNIEFETACAFGSKCGVSDLAAVFHAYMLANDYGMDGISCGNMIATFMELYEEGILRPEETEGLDLRFGNAEAMIELIHRIGNVEGYLGRLGAKGAYYATQELGRGSSYYTTCIKRMDTIATDPRVSLGFGLGFAVASRGSDHLRAHAVFEMQRPPKEVAKELFGAEITLSGYEGKPRMIFWHENNGAITDSMGICRFMHASYYIHYPVPEIYYKHGYRKDKPHSLKFHDWLSVATGLDMSYEELMKVGERIITLERAINLRRGVRRKDDTLPERFFKETVPTGPAKGIKLDRKRFEQLIDEYYDLRGWDKETGFISEEKLKELGMTDVLKVLKDEGLVTSRERLAETTKAASKSKRRSS